MDNQAAVDAVVGRLHRAGVLIREADQATLEKAALTAKRLMLDAPGAPRMLRGVGRKGAKTTVRYKLLGHAAAIRWYGPAHLVDRDTSAHYVTAKGLGRRSSRSSRAANTHAAAALGAFGGSGRGQFGGYGRAGKKALTINGGFAAYAAHPGTHGKHFYELGREAALAVMPGIHRQVVHDALRSVYKGD